MMPPPPSSSLPSPRSDSPSRPQPPDASDAPGWARWGRWGLRLAVALGLGVLAGGWLLGAWTGDDLAGLVQSGVEAAQRMAESGPLGLAVFGAVYAGAVALSLPGAAWMTLAAGALFGTVTASAVVVIAATLGATGVFLIVRYLMGPGVRARLLGARGRRLEAGLRRNAFSTLLAVRLVPLFPFWLVNLAPAVLGVPLAPYVAATALGIIPGTVVYAAAGAGVGEVLTADSSQVPALLLRPEVLLPLLGLAVLAVLPAVVRHWRARRRAVETADPGTVEREKEDSADGI